MGRFEAKAVVGVARALVFGLGALEFSVVRAIASQDGTGFDGVEAVEIDIGDIESGIFDCTIGDGDWFSEDKAAEHSSESEELEEVVGKHFELVLGLKQKLAMTRVVAESKGNNLRKEKFEL